MEVGGGLVAQFSRASSSSSIAAPLRSCCTFRNHRQFSALQRKAFITKASKLSSLLRFSTLNKVVLSLSLELNLEGKKKSWNRSLLAHFRIVPLQGRRGQIVTSAVSTVAVSTVVTIAFIGAAAVALARTNKDKPENALSRKKQCESCDGSGLCSSCNGEGFILKNLSPEAKLRARANSKTAATRYTAGLAKKWSYCSNCSGSRGCPVCKSSGWVE